MRFIKMSDVEPGMVLAKPVICDDGRLLLKSNAKLTTYLITRLNKYSHKGIFIYDELSNDIDTVESIPISLRLQAIQATKELNFDACTTIASEIIDKTMSLKYIETNFTNLSMFDNDTYNHCVNVANYSAIVGITLGYNEDKLKKLIMAALLHDIGKIKIPYEILSKPDKLDDVERDIMNKHPLYSYLMLKDIDEISSVIKCAVYQHHENEDGSGYPCALSSNKIIDLAKVIHVCDVYDAMISKRPYKGIINPADVVEYLYSKCGTMFDIDIVRAFNSRLIPYPVGVPLILSNGRDAIVTKNNDNYPLRPDVRYVSDGEDISLIEHTDIVILGFDDV